MALVTPGTTVTGNPGVGAGEHLFVAAREDERIAALEPHDELARLGPVDQYGVDRVLRHRPAVGDLGGVDHLDVRRQFGEQFRRRQPVGDHDVGVGEQPPAAHGDQFGVAGTAADQRHSAVHDAGSLSPVIRPCCNASWIADRMAADRRCSPPASTPTDKALVVE